MIFNPTQIDKILDIIFPLPEKFGTCEDGSEDFSYIKNAIRIIDPKATICYGISKMVIIAPSIGDVVIKIPFNGYFYEAYIDEDANNYDTEWTWMPFENAEGTDPSDYCLTEYEKYQELIYHELDFFAAEILFYAEKDGIRIFLQEKVTSVEDSFNTPVASKKSKDLAKEWIKEQIFSVSTDWIANCIDIYGEDDVKRFLYYCDNVDPCILRDMHRGNYGYRENNTPVLIDYSDFQD